MVLIDIQPDREINWSGKNRRLSSIFDSCRRNEVSNFRLKKFAKVEPFCDLYGADVDADVDVD